MDQRLRLMAATTVIIVGLGLAFCFRRSSTDGDLPIAVQSDPLVLRKQPDSGNLVAKETSPAESQRSPSPLAPAEPRRASPTIVTPSDRPAPPPELPKNYPYAIQPSNTRWGASLGQMLPESASAPPRHKIIDNDTLALLAERYLGSASRAMEIYEANRDVPGLTPEILPMGAVLKIPRADPDSAQAANTLRP